MTIQNENALRLTLDKLIGGLPFEEKPNFKGERIFSRELRRLIKDYTAQTLEGLLRELGEYGTKTHSYSVAWAYLVEFKEKI